MIRAICSATLLFFDSNDHTKPDVLAPMLQIVELPDWVKNTNTFRVNLACGRIKVMNDGAETKKVEAVQEAIQDEAPRVQAESLESEIAKMKNAELKAYCDERSIKYKGNASNAELRNLITETMTVK